MKIQKIIQKKFIFKETPKLLLIFLKEFKIIFIIYFFFIDVGFPSFFLNALSSSSQFSTFSGSKVAAHPTEHSNFHLHSLYLVKNKHRPCHIHSFPA